MLAVQIIRTENIYISIITYYIHLPAKMQRVCHVNSTIHESKTISWRHLFSVHVINNAECTVILLTIASAGGPPLNISPWVTYTCIYSKTREVDREML